jgi:hypothetical protein
MMDASHRLWPVVVATAGPLGWVASLPARTRGPFTCARGAKSCLVLQRVGKIEGRSSSGGGTAGVATTAEGMQAELSTFAQHLRSHAPTSRMPNVGPASSHTPETQASDRY